MACRESRGSLTWLLVALGIHVGLFAALRPGPRFLSRSNAKSPTETLVVIDGALDRSAPKALVPLSPPNMDRSGGDPSSTRSRFSGSGSRDHAKPSEGAARSSIATVEIGLDSTRDPGSVVAPSGSEPNGGVRGIREPGVPPRNHLTLEQLGVGDPSRFLSDPLARPPESRASSDLRLAQALRTQIVQSDQRHGLGPEAALLTSLEQETQRSLTPVDSSALFRATTNDEGRLASLVVLEATSSTQMWERVASQVMARLGSQGLYRKKGLGRVRMDLRVTSRAKLMSGKDPGLGLDVLRVPMRRAKKKDASRISLLRIDPKFVEQEVKMPDGETVTLPVFSLGSLLEVVADPVDLVPKERRVVHARLEQIEVEPEVLPSRE